MSGRLSAQDVKELMLQFRCLVLDVQEENLLWKARLYDLEHHKSRRHQSLPQSTSSVLPSRAKTTVKWTSTSGSSNNNSSSSPATTTPPTASISPPVDNEISSSTISSANSSSTTNATNSTRPPPYKTAVSLVPQPTHSRRHTLCHRQQTQDHNQTTLHPDTNTSEAHPQPPARTRRHARTLSRINYLSGGTMSSARGALIVLEGLDRVGKSTLAKKLVEHFERTQRQVAHLRFPERTTPIGLVISEFLKNPSKHVDHHAMHLLFSANRWEFNTKIRKTLLEGITIVVDRYSYSGIAYSSAKKGLTMDWCCESEKGLPQPDLVIYLELPKEEQYSRPGFGDERFETKELQELIRHQYEQLMEKSHDIWLRVDVEDKSPDQILAEIITPVKRCIEACAKKKIGDLTFL